MCDWALNGLLDQVNKYLKFSMKHQINIQGVSKLAIKTWHQISEGLIQYIGQVF